MLSLGGGWWGSRRAGGGQLRYVKVVDRGERIEASMSGASERASEGPRPVRAWLPTYLGT